MKLTAALVLPLAALVLVTSIEVVNTSNEVDAIRSQTNLARSVIGPAGLISRLQNERTWLAVELVGFEAQVTVPVEGYDETRRQTDEAIEEFRADISGRGDDVVEAFQPAFEALEALPGLRSEIDANDAPRELSNVDFAKSMFEGYTAMIEPVFDATTRISLAVDDPELRQGAELADAVARAQETIALLSNIVIEHAVLSTGGVDKPSEITEISLLQSRFRAYAETMRTARGRYAAIAADTYPADLVNGLNQQVDQAIAGSVELEPLLAVLDVPRDGGFFGYQNAVHEAVNQRADELNSAAESRRLWFGSLAVAAVAGAGLLTFLVTRSITRPLRSLTRQAKEMAENRLPDAVLEILETPLGDDVLVPNVTPVRVKTRDEVADVADALNTVQDSALDLAVEQAVLRRNIADSFVNLGRRNQNLLGRQLDFITELESNETHPDTLASLFRLDHLATRMRRNAESLLVLAGIDPPRKWAAPVRLTDVIRAALGEVEDYQRVTVRGVEPATIIGSAAADLAHLLAEFIENALTFSPPDQNVDIRGRHRPDDGVYTLAVIDAGFGMPAADIAQANRRLAGAESFTVAPSKYLGHYVAGNLASRHGIRLQLDNSPGNGVTTSVELPPALLTAEQVVGDPITDPRGTRAARVRPPAAAPAGPPTLGAGPGDVPWDGAAHGPGALPAADPPAPGGPPPAPARTASGLVRRPARGEGGPRRQTTMPSGDLLAALDDHARRLGPGLGARQQGPSARGGDGAGQGPRGPAPAPGAPLAGPPGPAGPGRGPRGRAPAPGTPPSTDWMRPYLGQTSGSVPSSVPPTPPGGGRHGPQGAAPPVPPAPRVSPPTGRDPTGSGTTPGGLTRRVRGAQLPPSHLRPLHPGDRRPSPAPAPPASRSPAPALVVPVAGADDPEARAARDVYSFLTNFSAGVQRGLDEARGGDDPEG
jgi:signal transduction histidine kinase